MKEWVFGRNPVYEVLRAQRRHVFRLLVAEGAQEKGRLVEILRLAQRGLPNPQIAESLHISAGTVRNHLSAVYSKLGVHSRHEALQAAAERRLI